MTEETDKMKDLLIKLQILTNGLVEERKKSKNYLDKIKHLEKMLQQKDNEVVELTKQKFELQAQLTFEKSKKPVKQNNKLTETQINQYEEVINEQGFKLRELDAKMKNEKEIFAQQKAQFKNIINEQNSQITDLKEKYQNSLKTNKQLMEQQETVNEKILKFEEEKKQYDQNFRRYQNDKVIVQNKNVELSNQLDELRKEKYEKENEIEELKKKNEDLSIQLIQMKTNLINKQLTPKSFKVEMIKPKKYIEIVLQKNKELDNYEMVIKGRSKKEEHINLLDISIFEINIKDKNRIDIVYMVSKNNFLNFV